MLRAKTRPTLVLSLLIEEFQKSRSYCSRSRACQIGARTLASARKGVSITRKCGVFEYLAIWSAKLVKASPAGILAMLAVVTAVASALLDNVTTVLLMVPVTLVITEQLKVNPYPFLFSQILASNIGGTATLIGDPPNILIGTQVGLSFNEFVVKGLSPRLRRLRNVVRGGLVIDRTYSEHPALKVRHDRLSALAHRVSARFPG